ncbi:hypothetical protein PQX77_005277 [Marasmius sp. AFHP31]|nr:hypothetical protein PQX77_005277 [Marasmius sp. AFHP31]
MSTSNATLPAVEEVITLPIATVLVMCIVYGFYALLFGLCIYVLRRGESHCRNPYITCTSFLFLLSTFTVIVETMRLQHESNAKYLSVKDRLTGNHDSRYDKTTADLYTLRSVLLVLSNIVADSLLIHRCYVIWGSKKRIALPLVLVSCAPNVVSTIGLVVMTAGYKDSKAGRLAKYALGDILATSGLVASVSFNMALTLLTESGMLYPLVMILHFIIVNCSSMPLDTFPLLILAAGIAPTLVIVLTRLAIHIVEDSDATYSRNPSSSQLFSERSFRLSQGLSEPQVPRVEFGTKPVARNDNDVSEQGVV